MATIKNLVKFAAKFLNMAKTKPNKKKEVSKAKKAKPAAKAKGKPVTKKVSKPVKKTVSKPKKAAPKKVAKAKPVTKKKVVVKPASKKKVVAKVKPVKKVLKKTVSVKKPVAKKQVKASKPVNNKKELKKAVVKKQPKPVKVKPVKVKKEKPVKEVVVKVPGKKGRPAKPVEKRVVVQAVKPEAKTYYHPIIKPQPAPKPEVSKKKKPVIDSNLRYSDDELKEFKDLIDKKLVSAREELKYLKDSLDNHNDSQAGSKAWNMEEGTDTSEMETLMNQISRQHQYIRNLELALVRVENKTYGICRVTGKLIPKERLRVVPHATLSLEAKIHRKKDDEVTPASATAAPPADFTEGFED